MIIAYRGIRQGLDYYKVGSTRMHESPGNAYKVLLSTLLGSVGQKPAKIGHYTVPLTVGIHQLPMNKIGSECTLLLPFLKAAIQQQNL